MVISSGLMGIHQPMMTPLYHSTRIQDLPIRPTSRSRSPITNPHWLLDIPDFFVISLLLLIHDILTTHLDTTSYDSFLLSFPFCKTFPFLDKYISNSLCPLSNTLLARAHEPALYPVVYIPRLGYDVLPRFDIN